MYKTGFFQTKKVDISFKFHIIWSKQGNISRPYRKCKGCRLCGPLLSELFAPTWLIRWFGNFLYIYSTNYRNSFLKMSTLYVLDTKNPSHLIGVVFFAAIFQRDERCMCERRPVHRKTNSAFSETHFVIEHRDFFDLSSDALITKNFI